MASRAHGPSGVPWRLIGWGGAVALLLVPLVLQFPWTLSDFIFAGAVFGIVGGTFELAVRKRRQQMVPRRGRRGRQPASSSSGSTARSGSSAMRTTRRTSCSWSSS